MFKQSITVADKRKSRAKPPTNEYGLNDRHLLFCQHLVADETSNATAAAIKAGFAPTTADQQASRLSRNVKVQACLAALRAARAERMQVKADDVLARWLAIANADPNELIELRRICCRYCHGKRFRYQRTHGEMEAARVALALKVQALPVGGSMPAFDEQGGIGYDARKDPHLQCPECFGQGVLVPYAKDTRHLSVGARQLYDGVKVTKDGLEIKTLDRAAALLNVAKHIGMFVSKVEHTVLLPVACIPIEIVGIEIIMPEKAADAAL